MIHKIFAQSLTIPGGTGNSSVTLTGPATGFSNLGSVVSKAIPYIFFFAGVGLLLMLISGGFSLLMGGSNPKQLESGRQRITYAIVGFFIVFFAFWAVQLVARIFGLDEFKIFG